MTVQPYTDTGGGRMIEIPEGITIARQLTEHVAGKTVAGVTVGHSPHKFAWYFGESDEYEKMTVGKAVSSARGFGSMVEAEIGDTKLIVSEGASLRYHPAGSSPPKKHQLLVELSDQSFLTVSVQMYGGIGLVPVAWEDNPYYVAARDAPSPLEAGFTDKHFRRIVELGGQKLSAKALLATEQRIPGLGNGVLQDILFNARIHPKRKVGTLSDEELGGILDSITGTLRAMTDGGGRDTEIDLLGNPGGYRSILSRNTVGTPCPECATTIEKLSYMGGSVYVCPKCQQL
jgi:formamidopyrimidine-DNA glycosylase